MNILIGLFFMALGVAMVIKTEPVYAFTGASRWAEDNLGSAGGTRLLIKLIGVVFIFIGMATITGLINGMLEFIARLIVPGA